MLDVVVKCVAVPDALERKPGYGWNKFSQARMRGSEPASHIRGEKRAQRLRSQFRNCNHGVIALSLQPGFDCPCATQTVGHAAPLGGCADADAVLPLLPHAKRSPTQEFLSLRQLEARISAHGAASDL